MTAKAQCQIVVLFEDELQVAAEALTRVLDSKDASAEEYSELVNQALSACLAALGGAQDKSVTLLLGRKSMYAKVAA